jgi:hypothetical protein
VGIVAAITVFFAAQLPKAQMDNNISNFLPLNNPARLTTEHLEAEYGDEITIIVGLERPYGTVFDSAFLSRMRDFTGAVENIELVKSVNSVVSSQYLTVDSESIIVTDLVDEDFFGNAGRNRRTQTLPRVVGNVPGLLRVGRPFVRADSDKDQRHIRRRGQPDGGG